MSNICIGLIRAAQVEHQSLMDMLLTKTHEIGFGVSFSTDWDEPIWDKCDKEILFFSICDSNTNSNCEMLLLPDDWFYNGKANAIPFVDRMTFLQELAEAVQNMGYLMEFYIGVSGTLLDEYYEASVPIHNVGHFLANNLYSYTDYFIHPLHVIVEID